MGVDKRIRLDVWSTRLSDWKTVYVLPWMLYRNVARLKALGYKLRVWNPMEDLS
jgi:hypothetical protein